MPSILKILLITLVGFFFSIAILEIDVFDYDNTFFDAYDSYVQVDNQLFHQGGHVGQDCFALSQITLPPFCPFITFPTKGEDSVLSVRPHKGKLYLTKSALLI